MSINTTRNCASSVLGTGTRGCRTEKKYINRRFLIEKGYSFAKATDTFDDATINGLIQRGVLVPLPNDLGAEAGNTEATYETINTQDIPVSGIVYGWRIKYKSDQCLARALATLSNKSWDLLEVDEDGELNAVETTDGFIKGFDVNLVKYEGLTNNDGSVGSKLTLRIQLTKTGSKEYDSSFVVIPSGQVDWSNLKGVDEVSLSAAGGKLKAVFACDGSTPITGLTTANVRAVDDTGAVVVGFTITSSGDGLYTVGGLTGGEDYTIYLYDSTLNTRVIAMANYFYKSNELLWVAV